MLWNPLGFSAAINLALGGGRDPAESVHDLSAICPGLLTKTAVIAPQASDHADEISPNLYAGLSFFSDSLFAVAIRRSKDGAIHPRLFETSRANGALPPRGQDDARRRL